MITLKPYKNGLDSDDTEEIGKQAAALSLIEIGLGSFLHSFKIPLTGHLLSINQIAFLSRSSFKLNSLKAPLQISLISSFLKSLSPAGKKLTPMLAIAAQGIFYYLGLYFFGINYFGLFWAVLMSSLWAFIQPVLFIYLLFGKNSLSVAEYFLHEFEKLSPHANQIILRILIAVILLKLGLAFFFSVFAIKMNDSDFNKYQNKMLLEVKVKTVTEHSAAYMALRDLFTPIFIVSFLMTAVFFVFSHSLSMTQIIWNLLRPLAIGYVLFYLIRVYPAQNLIAFLTRKGFTQLSKILDAAIKKVRETRGL